MSDIFVRRAGETDLPAILELLRVSMGRDRDDRFEDLFRWKHLDNAFGPSPMWVACDGDAVVGLRVLMRWEFERAGTTVRTVRAVDTATHPDYQGRGIFTRLTLAALDDLATEGVEFVFNTPNAQSRPGYLKMGWHELGRPVVSIRPTRLGRLPALRGARMPAQHWSEPLSAGRAAADFIADRAGVAGLLDDRPGVSGLRTRTDLDVLAWRFGLPALAYRAICADLGDGAAFVRVRARGTAREAVVALLLVSGRPGAARRVLRHVRETVRDHADYMLGVGAMAGSVRSSRLGPVVTARPIAGTAPRTVADLRLALGDIELF